MDQLISKFLREHATGGCGDRPVPPCGPGVPPDGVDGWHISEPPPMEIGEAVRRACLSESSDGKLDRHQRRLGRPLLRRFWRDLSEDEKALDRARTFEEVHAIVSRACRRFRRAGPLLAYDVSLRICRARRKAEPAYVYLHSGAAEGARRLGVRGERAGVHGPRASIEDFPPPMGRLTPAQAEGFLCIYKKHL